MKFMKFETVYMFLNLLMKSMFWSWWWWEAWMARVGNWEYIPCLWEEVEWVQNGVCVVSVGLAT